MSTKHLWVPSLKVSAKKRRGPHTRARSAKLMNDLSVRMLRYEKKKKKKQKLDGKWWLVGLNVWPGLQWRRKSAEMSCSTAPGVKLCKVSSISSVKKQTLKKEKGFGRTWAKALKANISAEKQMVTYR